MRVTHLLSYLHHYGTDQTDDPKIKRNIRFLTTSLLIAILSFAFFIPQNLVRGFPMAALAEAVLAVLVFIFILVNRTRHYLAYLLTFFAFELLFFILAQWVMPGQRLETYFLLMAFIPHIFSRSNALYLTLFAINMALHFVPQLTIQPYDSHIYSYATHIANFIIIFLVGRYFREQARQYEKQLKEQNIQLQKDKNTIETQSNELQKLSDLKSEFFANISHELRTPLTLVQGQLEALKSRPKNELELEDRISKATRNTRQLAYMIDDLLDLSRLELKALTIQPMPTDMILFVRRTVASFHSLAESKQVRLETEITESSGTVALIDIRQFEKVISNLLYNAFKFTPSGGLVRLTISESNGHITVNVFNSGRPIPEGDLPRLFDRFYQASGNDMGIGSGIGLAIAKEIVELHEGTITVANVAGGVAFTVSVPKTGESIVETELETIEQADISSIVNEKLAVIPSDKPLILVVEDNTEMQEYLDEVLSSYFRLEKAENGKEALDKLAMLKPQLILADVMMPEMDGFELLEKIKKSASWFHIPMMFLTALASREEKLKGLRMGLDDYLTKPFDRDELVIRIANLVHNLGRRLALARELEQEEPDQKPEADAFTAEPVPLKAVDEQLVRKAQAYIESNISDPGLSVKMVAESLGMSERQWYRKVAALVGMTPNEFITEIKLQYARKLLLAGKVVKQSQLVHELGYSKDSYFSTLFYQRFGKRPSDFLDR